MILTIIRKLNSPLKDNADYFKECGIPPLILRLSLSRGQLKEYKPYYKNTYIFIISLGLTVFLFASWLTYSANEIYHESPDGWALLKLTSTNERFLISLNEATSPDKKSWAITPDKCASQLYENIATKFKISRELVDALCTSITIKKVEPEIQKWIIKIHNSNIKLMIFFTPLICILYWFAIALFLDALLKISIDKYNRQQAERAKLYLT